MDVLGEPPSNFRTISGLFVLSYLFLFRDTILPKGPTKFYEVTRRCLTVLVILHVLYTLRILLSPPINLFSLLELPLTAPVQAIRVALLRYQKDRLPVGIQNRLLPHVETLLNRLASFEARITYMKHGPYPLAQCEHCVYSSDFLAFVIAPTVLPYLRTLLLCSLLTSAPTYRTAWRTPSLFVLSVTFFTEAWWIFDTRVQFHTEKVDGWTYTHTFLGRYTILLLLPLLIHILPPHSSPSSLPPFIRVPSRPILPHLPSDFNLYQTVPTTPKRTSGSFSVANTPLDENHNAIPNVQIPVTPLFILNRTIESLNATLGALHVFEWTRLAGLRRKELRDQISDYFATADSVAVYARTDPAMMQEAESLGMGYNIRLKQNRIEKGKQKQVDTVHENNNGIAQLSPNDLNETNVQYRDQRDKEGDDSGEESDDSLQSPLRLKARQRTKEIANIYWSRVSREASTPGPSS